MSTLPKIVSFPKSGRTWVRYALSLEGLAPEFTHAGHGAHTFELGKPFGGVPDTLRGQKLVFLHRNPLDTAVSYFFQLSRKDLRRGSGRWWKRAPILSALGRMPPQDIADFVRHPGYGVPLISAFNRGWLDALASWDADVHVASYEALKANPAANFAQIFDFLGHADADVAGIAEKSSFDNMRSVEQSGAGRDLRLYVTDKSDPESAKVRKGKVRGYSEYLDDATIADCAKIAQGFDFEI